MTLKIILLNTLKNIFLDNDILLNQREKIFKKIIQKKYDKKKSNESLKNITISDLSQFDYFYFLPKNIQKFH